LGLGVRDLLGFGFGISGFGFGTSRFGFGVSGTCEKQRKTVWILVIRVRAFWYLRFGFRVSGCGIRVSGFRVRMWGFRIRISGVRCRGVECRV